MHSVDEYFFGIQLKRPAGNFGGYLRIGLAAIFYFLLHGTIPAQTAQFSFQPAGSNFCAPAQIKFIPEFSETPLAFYWQTGLGDEESQELTPSITYTTPGTYRVTLIVLFGNVLREITQTITVHGLPALEIKPSRNFLCQPDSVNFSLTSGSDLMSTTWDFGDGNNQSLADGDLPVSHRFGNYGGFAISVLTEDRWGCKGSGSLNYVVKHISAELIDTPLNGCVPVEVFFQAKVTVPDGSSVTRYVWDFNDGSTLLSTTDSEVRHTFNKIDTFKTSVSITTSEGCTNSFFFDPLAFANQLDTPVITANKTVGCASEKMYFTTSANGATKYFWSFDDGSLFASSLELPTLDSVLEYVFHSVGDFSVRVVAEKNGCRSEVSEPVTVSIKGVVADFTFSNTCIEKNRFSFRNTSDGVVNRIQWTFIDSNNKSSLSRPVFTFPRQGAFPVILIVTENSSGCSDTATSMINTAIPKLLAADSFVCMGGAFTLGVASSYQSPNTLYSWNIGGRSFSSGNDSNITVSLYVAGLFTNRVIINNGSGYCRDTLVQENILKVSGPKASFISPSLICQSESILPLDSSGTAFAANPIVAWRWNFGNGMTSSDQNPQPFKYVVPSFYTLSLEVEDVDGCKSVSTKWIRVARLPLLRIVPRNQKVCQGEEISLNALHKGSILWSQPGTNGCDTCSVINVKPMAPVKIIVKATDGLGCISDDSISLDIWYPFELPQGALRDTGICIGSSVLLSSNVSGKLINWFPSSGLSSSVISNPVAKPDTTTKYTVVVTDSGRCFTRTASVLIEVHPFPLVDPGPDLVIPYNAPYTIKPAYSNGIASYAWQPANLLSCFNCPEPSGIATTSTLFTVNVVSDKGCKSSARIRLTLDCSEKNLLMPTAFTPNNDGLNDYFYPLTRGISIIRRFVIYNRLGQLVYENKNFKPNERGMGWNGIFNGIAQPAGSFVYFVEAECDLGNSLSTKGNIMLMR